MRWQTGLAALLLGAAITGLWAADTGGMQTPRYDESGNLLRPTGYERWVLAGTSIGLGYSEARSDDEDGPGLFHAVYIQPQAFAAFRETGEFPEGTMLALLLREPREKVKPALTGYFQGEVAALEIAVKDSSRFGESWAYYDFEGRDGKFKTSAKAFPKERCHSCHAEHAADDNVFTQFYPALRGDN